MNALTAFEVPRSSALAPGLRGAVDRSVADAQARHTWLRTRSPLPSPLPDQGELTSVLSRAISAEDPHAVVYGFNHDGSTAEQAMPTEVDFGGLDSAPGALQASTAMIDGGCAVMRASRHCGLLADLCDDVALAIGGPVGVAIIAGTIPGASRLLRSFEFVALVPVAAPASVIAGDGGRTAVERLHPVLVDSGASIEVERPGVAIVIYGRRPIVDDLWEFAVRKAAHWPRLRADLPYDLDEPVVAYGEEIPVDPVDLLALELDQLFSDETRLDAHGALRARVRPAPRPLPDASLVPRDLGAWASAEIRGCFPGGVSLLAAHSEEEVWLAFGGCAVRLAPHLVPVIEALQGPVAVSVTDLSVRCPHEDPDCVARAVLTLHALGNVILESRSG